ncbi:hypothetical protein [Catelliglobosispora koreensis]|uniref:hypothetical protein n=1 Tax=Catelliglobosispora koreensis TaxID=129052 RepID=UPI0012F7B449|nr:hypothetical protein [Catelliglobosispora koreensis]
MRPRMIELCDFGFGLGLRVQNAVESARGGGGAPGVGLQLRQKLVDVGERRVGGGSLPCVGQFVAASRQPTVVIEQDDRHLLEAINLCPAKLIVFVLHDGPGSRDVETWPVRLIQRGEWDLERQHSR